MSGNQKKYEMRPQSRRLFNLVCNAAACVSGQSQGRRRAVRVSDLRVVRTGPDCCEPRH